MREIPRTGSHVRTVVLTEGGSDRTAIETLALRRGRDLAAEGIDVVAMGGATSVGAYVRRYGEEDVALVGLCDAAEERYFRRAFATIGRGDLFVCVDDLEDELIRALGPDEVEQVIAREGELESFRIMQKQPAQRGRAVDRQLRRFLGTRSGRKSLYARALVERLDLDRVPAPLDALLLAL